MLHELTGWRFEGESHDRWPNIQSEVRHWTVRVTVKLNRTEVHRTDHPKAEDQWFPIFGLPSADTAAVLQIVSWLQQEGYLDDSG